MSIPSNNGFTTTANKTGSHPVVAGKKLLYSILSCSKCIFSTQVRPITKLLAIFACTIIPVASIIYGYFTGFSLFGILSLYGFFAISHLSLKFVFARFSLRNPARSTSWKPSVSVIVPVYNESSGALESCLKSLTLQDYPAGYEVVLIDDGSTVADYEGLVERIKQQTGDERFKYHRFSSNRGKRQAMYAGFEMAEGDVVVNTDSDTILMPNAIAELVRPLEQEDVAAVTGDVGISNVKESFLARLINIRYWYAFNEERAAQSHFGVVSCVSGPLGAYKKEVIDACKDKWLNQTFLGIQCTFGDDRHLTNLVLAQRYKVKYAPRAKAFTAAPNDLAIWIKQQTRWTKSFYREFFWTLRTLAHQHIYLSFDLTLQLILPIFLVVNVSLILYKALCISPIYLLLYPLMIVFMGGLRSLFGYVHRHSFDVFFMALYGFLSIFVLLPVRMYALLTLCRNNWGTR